ncbi:MAG: hypothetical protein ABIG63_17475 [Chloroflexota bacterium]
MTSYSEYDRGYENGVQDTLDENPPLKWTTEPPTEEGWYWMSMAGVEPIVICCVSRVGKIFYMNGNRVLDVDESDRWAGPIRLPGDEK